MGGPGSGKHSNKGRRRAGGPAPQAGRVEGIGKKPSYSIVDRLPKTAKRVSKPPKAEVIYARGGRAEQKLFVASPGFAQLGKMHAQRGSNRQYAKKWRAAESALVKRTTGLAFGAARFGSEKAKAQLPKYNTRLAKVRALRPKSTKANPRWRIKPSS